MRVPPDQSGTDRDTAVTAASSRRARSSRRDAREPRGEQERLDAPVPAPDRVREVQEHARVALHRAADVAEQDERARPRAAPAPRQRTTSPPVRTLRASARRRSMRGPRPRTHRRVRRSPGCPHEPGERGARERDLVGRELREVLVARACSRRSTSAARAEPCPASGSPRSASARRFQRPVAATVGVRARARRLSAGGQRLPSTVHAPERVERAIEDRRGPRADGRAARGRCGRRRRGADVHVLQRLDDVEQAPECTSRPRRAQQAAEDEQIAEQAGHVTRDGRRSLRRGAGDEAGQRSPRTASMSSLDLSTTPSVASTSVGIERARDRAPRAPPPSRASRTRRAPCTARLVRSSCTSAVTCAASCADACGTRALDDRQFLVESRDTRSTGRGTAA